MSSPEEVEKFEVTDYDLENEFNPDRPRFRQTKHQALYGVWATSDDEDDGRRSKGSSKGKKNYSGPVSFISAGLKKPSQQEDADGDGAVEEDEGQEVADIRDFARKMYTETKSKPEKRRSSKPSAHSGSHDIGTWEKYTKGIGKKLLEKMGHKAGKGLGKNEQGIATPVEAVQRKGRGALGLYGSERTEQSKKDFPVHDSDEEDEKAFKQQLQQWKVTDKAGKKKPQYVFKTIDEVLTKGEKRSRAEQRSEMSKVKVIDMTGKEQRVLSGYHAISKRHDRPDSDDDDVGGPSSRPSDAGAAQPRAFDMPELLHNLNMLVDMTEEEIIQRDRQLRYEKDMVVNMQHEQERLTTICEQEEMMLSRLATVLRIVESLEARAAASQHGADALTLDGASCTVEAQQPASSSSTDRVADPGAVVADADKSVANAAGFGETAASGASQPLDLDECAALFKRLQDEFYEEYKMYELASLSMAIVTPLMKKHFATWQPLEKPSYGLEAVTTWKSILDEGFTTSSTGGGGFDNMDAYQKLLWDAWMPSIRTAVSRWNSRHPEVLLEVIEAWMPLLPTWMTQNILEQLVLPRLQVEVENWNPLTDVVPIHAWIHPWIPHLGNRLEILYAPIRHKLANALTNWHPSDISAKLMLQPWVGVFSQGHMDAFLLKNIVPKLAEGLQELVINPLQQRLDQWHWVLVWQDMLADQPIVSLFEKHFFPRWLQTLGAWLANPTANYDEIASWYKGWKSLIPDRLLTHTTISEQLSRALAMMSRVPAPGAPLPSLPPSSASSYYGGPPPPLPAPSALAAPNHVGDGGSWSGAGSGGMFRTLPSGMAVPQTFKELLEKRAADLNIVFVPVPGRTHEGRQVYRLGSLLVCIDINVAFMLTETGMWTPVSMGMLLERAARI